MTTAYEQDLEYEASLLAGLQSAHEHRWSPHRPYGRQKLFLNDLRYEREVFYGGAAGGMKSDALLQGALEYANIPGYAALLLRRTYKDLSKPGALIHRAQEWLRDTPAHWSGTDKQWHFPSGAILQFGHLDNENDKLNYQSSEFQFIGFDEVTHFSESQYTYLFSRLRRPALPCAQCYEPVRLDDNGTWAHTAEAKQPCDNAQPDRASLRQYENPTGGLTVFDVPLRMRCASNPAEHPSGFWVAERFVPDDFDPDMAEEPRVFWKTDTKGTARPFVPSRLQDNPFIDQAVYRESLGELDEVTNAQLERGDWRIRKRGNIYPQWDERYHVITWSEFFRVFGQREIPRHWQLGVSQDWGFDPDHLGVTGWFATAAQNSALPGAIFLYRAYTFSKMEAKHVASDLLRIMEPSGEVSRINRWLMSHEAASERLSYQNAGLPFESWSLDVNGGIDQVRAALRVRHQDKPNPFNKRDAKGELLMGWPTLMLIVDDDQLVNPRDDRGLARHRAEFSVYSYKVPKSGEVMPKVRPQELFNDAMDQVRCYAVDGFPEAQELTKAERVTQQLQHYGYKPENRPAEDRERCYYDMAERMYRDHLMAAERGQQKIGQGREMEKEYEHARLGPEWDCVID